jgi:aspartate/methionine/tyrosine aminotransferase
MKFGTKVIHAGIEPDPVTGAVMTPIYQTSTYAQESPGQHKGYAYARGHNKTRNVLQANLAALENASHAFCFGSGMAATSTVMQLLNPGDEVLYHEPCYVSYSPSVILAHGVPVAVPTFSKDNFRLTAAELEKMITPRSKVLMMNFPCNPTGATQTREELEKIAALCVKHDLIVLTDEIYSELTAQLAELRRDKRRLDWLESCTWNDQRIGNGIVIAPYTISATGERRYALQALGGEDGSNLGEELENGDSIRAAIDAARK